jgi:hypothetical protein
MADPPPPAADGTPPADFAAAAASADVGGAGINNTVSFFPTICN